ncbi:translation elongation factor 4 [Fluviispira multicolorata]|uniref:Elongation factor 4 n=1 Tax=Fluviispira multicolorata TaxID=2654512 RepID=A0A833N6H4_9BACT|nr:translation elongation factor 4 [Fluviispira multicolorata]KAB8033460.1 elongation factor 4 [Fluviispira multicolorata]
MSKTANAEPNLIRNFCIIAHIDHGKSTLADRLLEMTGAVADRDKQAQILDSMDLERERGITIKAQTATVDYLAKDGKIYTLNLIDTPGHVDFTYEVSRSLTACEGALLVVDATQGVEAQTVANVYLAADNNVEVLPVINKADLPSADYERVCIQIEEELAIDTTHAIKCSAKTGMGVPDILEAIIHNIPAPVDTREQPLRALIFDSWFDTYQGVIVLVRVVDGQVKTGDQIKMKHSNKVFEVQKLGIMCVKAFPRDSLSAGEVGYIIANVKDVKDSRVGDTICHANSEVDALPGFKKAKQMVFAGIFPVETNHYESLKDALAKLTLNDSSLSYEPETSVALGFGFRCGFLGLLHMEIIQERLEREYNMNVIFTAPTCVYIVETTKGEELKVDNPANLPPPTSIAKFSEPVVKATFHMPQEHLGTVMSLLVERRGVQTKMEYLSQSRVMLQYELPLNEMVFDFFDRLKSISRGYASMDYEFLCYKESDLVKLDILVNGEALDALSCIVHRSNSFERGRLLVKKLRGVIPRQQFEVALQAAIGSKIIARETLSAMRKDVTAKCYGGDISRKRKLLDKQKEGKKRMKQVGSVEIPQEAFMAILNLSDVE